MLADYVIQIQNDPALMALIGAIFVIVGLLIWRRAGPLSAAKTEVELLENKATERGQQLVEMREEMVRFTALKEQWQADYSELNAARAMISTQKADIASLNATLEHQRVTDGTLKEQFANLANEVMKSQSADFKKANAEQLKHVLEPLKDNIDSFKKELRGVHEGAGKERVELLTIINELAKQSQNVSDQAHNLTQALKGDSQKQGAWGEIILARILESSGLREGEEYETQTTFRDEENRNKRPDVIINFPDGRRLIVDSKVSLVAYNEAVNAVDDEVRARKMKEHIASVKRHIDDLSGKNYPELDDSTANYVILFMPIESAFSEAVRANLTDYAIRKNVGLASPTTLTVMLRTVEEHWSVERRNKNALEIAVEAGKMYDKFYAFLEDMTKLGNQMKTAQGTYGKAMNKLTEGTGNLVGRAKSLKALGADAKKQIIMENESADDSRLLNPPDTPS